MKYLVAVLLILTSSNLQVEELGVAGVQIASAGFTRTPESASLSFQETFRDYEGAAVIQPILDLDASGGISYSDSSEKDVWTPASSWLAFLWLAGSMGAGLFAMASISPAKIR